MYDLSALEPPAEGTAEHTQIIKEMEDLVKLVEAVKLVDCEDVGEIVHGVPDGRIWAEGYGIPLGRERSIITEYEAYGRALLRHAQRTENGFYVVPKHPRRS